MITKTIFEQLNSYLDYRKLKSHLPWQVSVDPTLKPTAHWLASHLPAPSDVHSLQFGAHAENRLDVVIIFRINN